VKGPGPFIAWKQSGTGTRYPAEELAMGNQQPQPPQLGLLDSTTLDQIATALTDCVAALSAGESLRGMDPVIVLGYLAELLCAAV
jgi:hypothetical protein